MIWVVLAILTGAAVLCVLWPLRGTTQASLGAADADFYRHQLADIEAEGKRGLLSAPELAAARLDAARRLLAATGAAPASASPGNAPLRRNMASLAAVALIPAITLGLYTYVGNPALPDQPLQTRLNAPTAELSMDAALARIESHLLKNPDDAQGFEIIAPIYLRLDRPDDAVRAYANLLRLQGKSPERLSGYGEALMAAAGGIVTGEAKAQFSAALAENPAEPKARYFLGLAAEQEGDNARAIEIWTKLGADAAPGAPWLEAVNRRLAGLGAPAAGPQGAAADAIRQMPAQDQQAAIRGMVEGLAARLSQNNNDLPGWVRLVRAYAVLNEPDKARAALGQARKSFASDSDAMRSLDGLGRDLGLGG